MKNQKVFLMFGGIVIGFVGIVSLVMSIASGSSPMTGIFILIIGTGILVTAIVTKPQKDDTPPN